jgi:hypothetical protein
MRHLLGVEVGVMGAGPPESFAIDTGMAGISSGALAASTYDLLEQLGRLHTAARTKAETLGGRLESRAGRVGRLRLGPFEHRDLRFVIHPEHSVLGLQFLGRYRATLDFPGGVMYLRESSRFQRPDAEGGAGIALLRLQGRTVVESTAEGSPASKVGIRKGDDILAIDGRTAEGSSILALGRLLCGDGRTVRIVIRRDGEVREVAVRLDTAWRTRSRAEGDSRSETSKVR